MSGKVLFYSSDQETCGLYEMVIGADHEVVVTDDLDEAITYLCYSHEEVDLAFVNSRDPRRVEVLLAAEQEWVPVMHPIPDLDFVSAAIDEDIQARNRQIS